MPRQTERPETPEISAFQKISTALITRSAGPSFVNRSLEIGIDYNGNKIIEVTTEDFNPNNQMVKQRWTFDANGQLVKIDADRWKHGFEGGVTVENKEGFWRGFKINKDFKVIKKWPEKS